MNTRPFAAIRPVLLAAILGLSTGLAALPAQARDDHDHERARRALQAGELLPLDEILKRVRKAQPGEVLEVELEREDGRWIYELKLLSRDGATIKLDVDGRDGSVLRTKRR
ncbi:MAG: PepSY domain-containing protein [Burkholderiales bacterium]|nr:PepSY domain-containing protein [Burkholderiales bacterium]